MYQTVVASFIWCVGRPDSPPCSGGKQPISQGGNFYTTSWTSPPHTAFAGWLPCAEEFMIHYPKSKPLKTTPPAEQWLKRERQGMGCKVKYLHFLGKDTRYFLVNTGDKEHP